MFRRTLGVRTRGRVVEVKSATVRLSGSSIWYVAKQPLSGSKYVSKGLRWSGGGSCVK